MLISLQPILVGSVFEIANPSSAIRFPMDLFCFFMSDFYLLLPSFFLYTLAWSLSELFAEIYQEMERAFAGRRDVGRTVQASGVRHSTVCQAVWKLEEFFQNIMLVSVAYIFVSSINFCYAILYRTIKGDFANAAIFLYAVVIRYVLINAVSQVTERLKNKVHFMVAKKTLFKVHLNFKFSIIKADGIHQCLMKSNLLYTRSEADQVFISFL